MITAQLNTIKDDQEALYNEVINTDEEGNKIKKNQYSQVWESEKLGYWVDVYDGPQGKGYIVMEERIVNGKTERKATNFGPEDRGYDWTQLTSE